MKKSEIKEAFGILKKTADMKSSLQVLSCAVIDAEGLTVTNLEETVTYKCDTGVQTPCVIGVPALNVLAPLNAKDKGEWTLVHTDVNGGTLEATDGQMNANLEANIKVEDFPDTPNVENVPTHSINIENFMKGLEYCVKAISTDETRPHINGLCLDKDLMISTNGHVLHWAPSFLDLREGEAIVLKRTTVAILMDCIKKSKGVQNLTISEVDTGFVRIECGKWTIVSRVIDSEFPPYDQVIPKTHDIRVEVEFDKLNNAIQRAKRVSSDRTLGVELIVAPDSLTLSSDNPAHGQNCNLKVSATCTKSDNNYAVGDARLTIGFNCDYMLTALRVKDCETVVIKLSNDLDPLVIHPICGQPDKKLGAVVMPMRI